MAILLLGAAAYGGVKVYRSQKKKRAIKKQNAAAGAINDEYACQPNGGRAFDGEAIPPPYQRQYAESPADKYQSHPQDYSDPEDEPRGVAVPQNYFADYYAPEKGAASAPVSQDRDTNQSLYEDEDPARPPIPTKSSARKSPVVSPLNFREI